MEIENVFEDISQRIDNNDIEDIFKKSNLYRYNDKELEFIKKILINLSNKTYKNRNEYDKYLRLELSNIKGKLKRVPSKVDLNIIYKRLKNDNLIKTNKVLEKFMKRKFGRSGSGELPITVFTSPSKFDCPEDCFYCPDEKVEKEFTDNDGKIFLKKVRIQPRSYLSTEPGCMRAAKDKFHPLIQAYDRIYMLELMGHEIDKIRFIILGGTYCYYPMDYRIWFITSLYYACNTYYSWNNKREMKTLEEEMIKNRDCDIRVSGITIETRPDRCTLDDCAHFMNCGITTIQLGIQQLDNNILKGINRRCNVEDIKKGTKRVLDCGLKLDTHYMFDLPGPNKLCRLSPDDDIKMIDMITEDSNFAVADQWKLYPTATTPHTKILKWYENMIEFFNNMKIKFNAIIIQTWYRKLKNYKWNRNNEQKIDLSKKKYLPYSEIDNGSYLIDILVYAKQKVHKDTRLNRIIRDIPEKSIVGGNKISNLRQHVIEKIQKEGLNPCRCIRCREIQGGNFNINDIKLDIYMRNKAGCEDYFISFEDKEMNIYGLARLRLLNNESDCLPILKNSAIIRELHVYGATVKTRNKDINKPQHSGLGISLVRHCEDISRKKGYKKIFITSGEGVIRYYEKKLNYSIITDKYNNIYHHYVEKKLFNKYFNYIRTEYNIYNKNGIILISIKINTLMIILFLIILNFILINVTKNIY